MKFWELLRKKYFHVAAWKPPNLSLMFSFLVKHLPMLSIFCLRSSKFDVALVRIPSVKFSERISPVCLPSPTQEYEQREVRSVIQTLQTQT